MTDDLQVRVPEPPAGGSQAASATPARRGLSLKEAALAWLGLVVVAVLVYEPHIRHGGFYFDDWSDASGALYTPGGSGISHTLSYFSETYSYRPALIALVPLRYFVFGTSMGLHLAWTIALAVIIAALVYGIVRQFRVPWYHAWLLAALTLVYPLFDSVRLWTSPAAASVAIILALGGLWVALVGLERRSWLLHGCAAVLYLLSILTYEIALPLIAAMGVLYVLRVGWRAGRGPWGVDLAVVAAAGIWDGLHTTRTVSGISGYLERFEEVVTGGSTIVGRTVIPVGPVPHTALALSILGLILAMGALAYWTAPEDGRKESLWGLREWLLLAAAGMAVAVLGWLIFVPADPYYTPSEFGFTNRVNALAGVGLVIVAYATIGVGVALAGRLLPWLRRWAGAVTIVFGLMLGAAYVHVLERHIGIWDAAFRAEKTAIDQMKTQFPTLPSRTTVFTSNYPAYQTLGVPIFAATWDLSGMIKLEYRDRTLSAYPLIPGLEVVCGRTGIGLRSSDGVTEAPSATALYGSARLLDLQSGAHSEPRNQRQCLAVSGRYVPGPLYLSFAY